jgi:hypothetical protein
LGTHIALLSGAVANLEHRRSILIKKYLAALLSVCVIAVSLSLTVTVSAQSIADADQTRSKVQALSVNRDKKVEVKLRDKTNYKGYITAVEPDSFTLKDAKTSNSQKFSYAEVEDVKKVGGGISTKTWIIIGGVAAGTVTTWLIVKPAFCDGGAQTRGIC